MDVSLDFRLGSGSSQVNICRTIRDTIGSLLSTVARGWTSSHECPVGEEGTLYYSDMIQVHLIIAMDTVPQIHLIIPRNSYSKVNEIEFADGVPDI